MYISTEVENKKPGYKKKTDAFIRRKYKKQKEETKATFQQCTDGDDNCNEKVAKHLAKVANKKKLQLSDSPSDSPSSDSQSSPSEEGGKTKRRSKKSKKSKRSVGLVEREKSQGNPVNKLQK